MAISGIGHSTEQYYKQLSSGKRINSAADDAAGLAIAEKLQTQTNGYDIGARNAGTAQDMINVADGGLSSITDSLQRMRDLSVQASNTAIYGADEISAMQDEISQLKDSISSIAGNTQFNTMNILDGSMGNAHIATNPDGSGTSLNMPDATLQALGIDNYDVTGNFDISTIDKALELVSGARSMLGAQSNALDHTISYNHTASYNTTASRSRIEDLDYGKAVSDLKKNQIMEEYRLHMQKKQEDENGRVIQLLRSNM